MKNSLTSSVQQPMIVKYVETLHNGIQSQVLSRYAIGYILRGTKYIYDGDKRQTLSRGDARRLSGRALPSLSRFAELYNENIRRFAQGESLEL